MPKQDFLFKTPLLNAAGSLGYAPDPDGPLDAGLLGGFITNPLSLAPRKPASGPRLLPYPGGFLIHTGHPNPGLRAALRAYSPHWARASLPVLVHVLAETPAAVARTVRRLEEVEGVAGLELSAPPDVTAADLLAVIQAALGELPVMVQLPLNRAQSLADAAAASGAAALSLGPPRGALPGPDGERVQGRLYGPGLFPHTLATVEALSGLDLPLIAGCGIYSQADVQACLDAGAAAVQLDAVLWKGVWG
jgi:dihydroorotate dehydrogenase (NAD+) catalytic subunit